jgi:hypothetical protein
LIEQSHIPRPWNDLATVELERSINAKPVVAVVPGE